MKINPCLILIFALLGATKVAAADDGDSYFSYDSIVSELKASADDAGPVRETIDWDAVALHGALAVSGSYLAVDLPNGLSANGLLTGFELQLGANLFSRMARGEVLFRNFNQDAISNSVQASMRELEGRIVFLPVLADRTYLRMGGGLSTRSVDVQRRDLFRAHESSSHYSLLVGFEKKIARTVSVGPDLSRHTPLEPGPLNKSSWDASFRLNATF